jgi:hypothetical protein
MTICILYLYVSQVTTCLSPTLARTTHGTRTPEEQDDYQYPVPVYVSQVTTYLSPTLARTTHGTRTTCRADDYQYTILVYRR